MSRKRKLFFNPAEPANDNASPAPSMGFDNQLIRTGRACHFVQMPSDGVVQVTTYKISHTWTTAEDEFLMMFGGWKTAKVYEEQE